MQDNNYDIIIIGGGATGSGIALDSSTRGYKTLLLEKSDFSSGTSSRSTKLVHGGVRYLEAAVKKFDKNQFNLVKEALKERARLLKNAPHLCKKLSLVTPIYKWWELPYMYIGLSLYDLISGFKRIGKSSIVCKQDIINTFPYIKKEGLVGAVKYYDGSFNDSKLNISIIKTAKQYGADCKNYHEVKEFLYENNKIIGVKVINNITNEKIEFYSSNIINATGIFADIVRKIDNTQAKNLLELSSGIHIVLDKKYLPANNGLMIPKTEDGRVLFILPWMGKCLVGTTDEKTTLSEFPKVEEKDIDYILKHLEIYFDLKIEKSEILSSWCGIRPLISQKETQSSSSIVREHTIIKEQSGLISILGGKWTTYRKMAEEAVDFIINNSNLKKEKCFTKKLKLVGSQSLYEKIPLKKVDEDIKKYLLNMYGDCSKDVLNCSTNIERLHKDYPYTNAELIYTIKKEFVKKPMDFLIRRTSLALIDKQASKDVLDKVLMIMAIELKWSDDTLKDRKKEALNLLENSI